MPLVLTVSDGTTPFSLSPTFGTTEVQVVPQAGTGGGGVTSVAGERGITIDNADPDNPIVGLPDIVGQPSPGVPLVWDPSSASWGPAQPPFAFAAIQATVLEPNDLDVTGEVSMRSAGGYVGIVASDSDAVLVAPEGGDAVAQCKGDGKSTRLNVENSAATALQTVVECTLLGESNDSPAIGFYGAPPVVQATIGGSTTTDLLALQGVVRSILAAGEALGLWIDGTT